MKEMKVDGGRKGCCEIISVHVYMTAEMTLEREPVCYLLLVVRAGLFVILKLMKYMREDMVGLLRN